MDGLSLWNISNQCCGIEQHEHYGNDEVNDRRKRFIQVDWIWWILDLENWFLANK